MLYETKTNIFWTFAESIFCPALEACSCPWKAGFGLWETCRDTVTSQCHSKLFVLWKSLFSSDYYLLKCILTLRSATFWRKQQNIRSEINLDLCSLGSQTFGKRKLRRRKKKSPHHAQFKKRSLWPFLKKDCESLARFLLFFLAWFSDCFNRSVSSHCFFTVLILPSFLQKFGIF